MPSTVTAFLPCRAGSQRVPKKNTRDFTISGKNLLDIKLTQLLKTSLIDKIIVSSDDDLVLEQALSLSNPRIVIDHRPPEYASSETTTDQLIDYVLRFSFSHLIWTHVTSPFVNADLYDLIIQKYFSMDMHFDSLMTVTPVHGFFLYQNSPLNFLAEDNLWPRTQTLEPLLEVNSAAFVAPFSCYRTFKNRIGKSPYLYKLSSQQGFDIDTQLDFDIAQHIHAGIKS